MVLLQDFCDDIISCGLIVGMACLVAAFNHFHPRITIQNQRHFKSLSGGISRTGDCNISLKLKIVLHDIPGEFVAKLKSLNQPLFF